ncbi:MAG: sugar phosphate isomerase/epimerase [Pseudobutyrivibrio sp.]|nr:sugar phosphate isomerase/epimerase [Pseudobutyrivibrio sp.]
MQIGIRFHDLKEGSIEERAAFAADQGFKCVHLALSKVAPYKMTLPELTPGWAMYLSKVFKKEQLDVAVLGCYLNLANPDEAELRHTQEVYKAHLRFAAFLGAGVVGTETGAPNREYKYVPECRSDAAFDTFLHGLEPVVKCAESMGQIIAIEPVAKHIIYSPKRARQALDAIASPNLQIIFDPVNMLDMDNYQQRDEIFAEAIDLLGKDIAMIHLKDFVVENNGLKSVGAGFGEMNYDAILSYAKANKPYIHATLEDTVPANAVAAREHIESILKRV